MPKKNSSSAGKTIHDDNQDDVDFLCGFGSLYGNEGSMDCSSFDNTEGNLVSQNPPNVEIIGPLRVSQQSHSDGSTLSLKKPHYSEKSKKKKKSMTENTSNLRASKKRKVKEVIANKSVVSNDEFRRSQLSSQSMENDNSLVMGIGSSSENTYQNISQVIERDIEVPSSKKKLLFNDSNEVSVSHNKRRELSRRDKNTCFGQSSTSTVTTQSHRHSPPQRNSINNIRDESTYSSEQDCSTMLSHAMSSPPGVHLENQSFVEFPLQEDTRVETNTSSEDEATDKETFFFMPTKIIGLDENESTKKCIVLARMDLDSLIVASSCLKKVIEVVSVRGSTWNFCLNVDPNRCVKRTGRMYVQLNSNQYSPLNRTGKKCSNKVRLSCNRNIELARLLVSDGK